MRLLIVCVFFALTTSSVAQFRCANVSFFLPTENPSLIVSPLEYNKASTYVTSEKNVGFQGQVNLNSIYSAVGITSNFMGVHRNTVGVQFATHSYLTRKTWHTGLGVQLERQQGDFSASQTSSKQLAWSLGWHVMSNPAGRFLVGVNYKNRDIMIFPFQDELVEMKQILSCQVGGSLPISRRSSVSLLALGKRGVMQGENRNWYQVTANLNLRRWTAGIGCKNFESTTGWLARAGLYYRNWMAAYVVTHEQFNFSKHHFIHEISISKKF
jgi:hypothetical protein